jgi:hypothetical protein
MRPNLSLCGTTNRSLRAPRRSVLSSRDIRLRGGRAVGLVVAVLLAAVPLARARASELGLSFQTTSSGTLTSGTTQGGVTVTGAATSIPMAGGSYFYGDSFTTDQTGSLVGSSGYGFFDDYAFTISTSSADSVTTTIDLGTTLQISNLSVRIFNTSSYNIFTEGGQPSYSPIPGEIDSVSEDGEQVINTVDLAAGTYVLEVRGIASGSAGGSYAGVLNIAPVPVPATLSLLLSGFAALGLAGLRRLRGTAARPPL